MYRTINGHKIYVSKYNEIINPTTGRFYALYINDKIVPDTKGIAIDIELERSRYACTECNRKVDEIFVISGANGYATWIIYFVCSNCSRKLKHSLYYGGCIEVVSYKNSLLSSLTDTDTILRRIKRMLTSYYITWRYFHDMKYRIEELDVPNIKINTNKFFA